ncbi:uncharacterized protein si:ch73-344o19.1 isoform X2 [Brienomyrus brachyistius]|uniref:uncharacterized protein si:ch73-344o19.1 isoform X2 n=1 Tax=Brienomyrus brachyistius TaxID=42636 RepID=UPI0020B415AF|nr:uncharacterized protein si:ch73-344o19.1 isoform X2 [Brienomyrus brachyistius]
MEVEINIVLYALAILIRASSFGGHCSEMPETTSPILHLTEAGSTPTLPPSTFPVRGSTEPDSFTSASTHSSSPAAMESIAVRVSSMTVVPSLITHEPAGLGGTATPQPEMNVSQDTSNISRLPTPANGVIHKEGARPTSATFSTLIPISQNSTHATTASAPSPPNVYTLLTLAPTYPHPPASTSAPAWLHVEDPSELNVGDDVPEQRTPGVPSTAGRADGRHDGGHALIQVQLLMGCHGASDDKQTAVLTHLVAEPLTW